MLKIARHLTKLLVKELIASIAQKLRTRNLAYDGKELLKRHYITIAGLTDANCVIDNWVYQTGVSTTCNSPTDVVTDCLQC